MDLVAAIDLSAEPARAIQAAAAWAVQLGATLHLRTVSTLQWGGRAVAGVEPVPEAGAWATLRRFEGDLLQELFDAHVPEACRGTAEVVQGTPEGIIERAGLDADLVICATHGRQGLSRLFSGSTSEAIVRTASCPILVLHLGEETPPEPIERVLVAIDPQDPNTAALEAVGAWFPEAGVDVVSVLADRGSLLEREGAPQTPEAHPRRAWALGRIAPSLGKIGFMGEPRLLVAGEHSVGAALSEAARGHDLIAVTTHGRRGLARLWWGSVAERLARMSPVPVLVVPSAG